MRVIITGANGFIGRRLVCLALRSQFMVDALVRRPGPIVDGRVVEHAWGLGDGAPQGCWKNVVCAYHLAHDFRNKAGVNATTAGTLRLIEELRLAGVPRQVFVSSLSAGPQAESRYGRIKTEIECAVRPATDVVVVRPGLVIGDGGVYGRIASWASWLPMVPLPDGGRGKIHVVALDYLCDRLLELAQVKQPNGLYAVQDSRPYTLRELVLQAAAARGRRPIIVTIPSTLLKGVLRAADTLGVPLPVTSDNLIGFLANQV